MPEATLEIPALPKKPPVATGGLDQSIPLMLTITDHDSVAELLQQPEGRERTEYALTALRIGLLALRHARGQIDADAVRHEADRLLRDLQTALTNSRNEIHNNLTTALKEYFDPANGRFQERVERLIKQDGDLEQVLRRQIGNDGSELAKTLTAHIGENSPLMKLLNPQESSGLVSSMRLAVGEVVSAERDRILSEFSLNNDQGALKRLVGELTLANGKLRTDLATEIGNVVQEFSLDDDGSALSRLVRRVETAEETITKEFSLDQQGSALSRLSTVINGAKEAIDANLTLDTEDSALSRLKREIVNILSAHEQKEEAFQSSVKAALEGIKVQRDEAARSTTHGHDFENVAADFIQKELKKSGDVVSRTGTTVGAIKNCKKGDLVVELSDDCVAAGARFVIEAKEDKSYTLPAARSEIETARKNREACVGLFVFSQKIAPEGMQALVRYGDDVFVVWDAEKIESDAILRAGLSLAKALCVRQAKAKQAEEGNWDDIDAAILSLEKEANRLDKMKTMTETIQSHSGKILEEVRKLGEGLEKQIEILRESVEALKQA